MTSSLLSKSHSGLKRLRRHVIERFKTPVVIVLFNRPDHVQELIAVLRQVQPRRILAIADGPRPTCPADVTECGAAREEVARIDWSCEVETSYSETNLGCDRRVVTGLDWVFTRTSEAIILEDDVLPHPNFLHWAATMLERYRHDADVFRVSGHNPLGRWPLSRLSPQPCGHIRTRRGSVWGWATTAQAWQALRGVDIAGPPDEAAGDLAKSGIDPLLVDYYTPSLQAVRRGLPIAWDTEQGIRLALRRGLAVVSSVNLVRNTGIESRATRTTFRGDFSGLIPVFSPVSEQEAVASSVDTAFDRAAVLIELLSRCNNPKMAFRLAQAVARNSLGKMDHRLRLHLVPFTVPAESLRLLDQLASLGVASPLFDDLLATLRTADCGG